MKLRKDNYAKATTPSGTVYGRVLRVKKDAVTLATSMGPARVSRAGVTKLSAAEFQAISRQAVTETQAAFENTTPGIEAGPAPVVKPESTPEAPKSVTRPGKKGTGKKAVAIEVFKSLTSQLGSVPTRKVFTEAIAQSAGLSAKGASTYYYSIKSGKWA